MPESRPGDRTTAAAVGGGAYAVSRDNFGPRASLVAAARVPMPLDFGDTTGE
jgi:hypothetical protein